MMRLFVFSDLHGNISQLEKVIMRISQEKATHVIFAGDLGIAELEEQKDLLYALPQELTIVRGNIDQPWLFMSRGIKVPLLYTSILFGDRIIAITHGNYFSYWQEIPLKLTEKDIFITGHTHVPHIRKYPDQPYQLNPGSSSDSRSSHEPSYALITDESIQIKSIDTGKQIDSFITYFQPVIKTSL